MPSFEYEDNTGTKRTATVSEFFLNLNPEEQKRRLNAALQEKYGTEEKPSIPIGEKGLFDWLSLLERPSQAIKVGLKESALGANLFRDLGGIDMTPQEGLLVGMKRGWLGDDEVRTQDFLPDDMDPILKGVLGFAGDVVTDPLTWSGGLIGKGLRSAGSAVKDATPKAQKLQLEKLKDQAMTKSMFGYTLRDVARGMNIDVGPHAKKLKQLLLAGGKLSDEGEHRMVEKLGELVDYFKTKSGGDAAKEAELKNMFVRYMDREEGSELIVDEAKRILGEDGVSIADDWGNTLKEMQEIERSAGVFSSPVEGREYFPRVATPEARKAFEERGIAGFDDMMEEYVDGSGKVAYRPSFSHRRKHTADIFSVNEQKRGMFGGGESNPADLGFDLFHTDPIIALGTRWSNSLNAIQKRWYINELTDGPQAAGKRWNFRNADGSPYAAKMENNFGQWIKASQDADGNTIYLKRSRNLDEDGYPTGSAKDGTDFDWVPISDDEMTKLRAQYVELKDINPKNEFLRGRSPGASAEEKAELIEEWSKDYLKSGVSRAEAAALATKDVDAAIAMENAKFFVPKEAHGYMKDHLAMMRGDQISNKMLQNFTKFHDRIQDSWKAWTLAVRPAYHTRNAVGNVLNAYFVTGLGSNLPNAVRTFTDAAKLQYYMRFNGKNSLRDETVKGLRNAGEGIAKSIDRGTLSGLPKIRDAEWTNPDYMGTGFSMEEIAQAARDRAISAGHYRKDIVRDHETALMLGQDKTKTGALKRFFSPDAAPVKAGFAIGGTIEGNARMAVFLNALKRVRDNPDDYRWIAPDGTKVKLSDVERQSHFAPTVLQNQRYQLSEKRIKELLDEAELKARADGVPYFRESHERALRKPKGEPQSTLASKVVTRDEAIFDIASQEVKAALFDYQDLSRFERNVLKRVFPFYTWTRKNIPAQLKALVQNPQRAEKLELARQQFEHNAGDLDESDYGKFWGDRVPVFLGGENDGVVKAFTLLNWVPMADLQRTLTPKSLVAEMIAPAPKAIFEQITNWDTFRSTERRRVPVVEKDMQTGMALSKDFLGVPLNPRLWHLAQLLVPLTEINRLNPAGVFGEKTTDPVTGEQTVTKGLGGYGASREAGSVDIPEISRWIRFFSGVRAYDINLKQQRYFMNKNLKKDIAALKGKLKYAAAKGENRKAQQIHDILEEIIRQNTTDKYN